MSFKWKPILRFIFLSPVKLASVILALCLLLSYLSVFISPAKIWFVAHFGLFFQVFFIINILLLLIWALFRRKMLWIHLIVLLPSIFFISSFIQLFNSHKLAANNNSLKIITYNVQMFQLPLKKNDSSYLKIAAFLNAEKPDIICLQEFYTDKQKFDENTFGKLLTAMKYKYVYYSVNKQKSGYGVATYSRYPIVEQGFIFTSKNGNTATYCDVDVNGKKIRVYNNHLQSIKLNLPKSIRRITNSYEERMEEITNVSLRLKTAFIKRAEQVDQVSAHIRQSPYPVIVCGDFNDTPMSYTYYTLKRGLKDAFREAGQGMPSTHTGFFPSFRIDYILHNKHFTTQKYNVSDVNYSDHFPVIAVIDANNK